MSEETKPALTREEWARQEKRAPLNNGGRPDEEALVASDGDAVFVREERQDSATLVAPRLRHALAALALHDQPFGFTREDVELLQAMAMTIAAGEATLFPEDDAAELRTIADRIAALLPPEPPT